MLILDTVGPVTHQALQSNTVNELSFINFRESLRHCECLSPRTSSQMSLAHYFLDNHRS